MAKKFRIPGVSFSAKRAFGVTSAKRKIAKATGIPTTRSGRRAKVGRAMGCALPFIIGVSVSIILLVLVF